MPGKTGCHQVSHKFLDFDAAHLLRRFCRKTGKRIEGFTDDALETQGNYTWSGNVRQLKNVVERLVIVSDGRTTNSLDLI